MRSYRHFETATIGFDAAKAALEWAANHGGPNRVIPAQQYTWGDDPYSDWLSDQLEAKDGARMVLGAYCPRTIEGMEALVAEGRWNAAEEAAFKARWAA